MTHSRPKIAFFDFAGCEGCQLTILDSLQTAPELLASVEIVEFREALTGHSDQIDIAFVEGSCTRPADEQRLEEIRARAKKLYALGACAAIGGINTIRNPMGQAKVAQYVYGEQAHLFPSQTARPIGEVVDIDGTVPGCPIDPGEFGRIVRSLLLGIPPRIPDDPICIECKKAEYTCVYQLGGACLGPVVRAGCGARCPASGAGCEGCRGLMAEANLGAMHTIMAGHEVQAGMQDALWSIFLSHAL